MTRSALVSALQVETDLHFKDYGIRLPVQERGFVHPLRHRIARRRGERRMLALDGNVAHAPVLAEQGFH